MKRYEGRRRFSATKVTVDGRPLRFRRDLRCHSPAEFEWGYGGSGPAQLALAILADHLNDDQEALNLYQRFKWAMIAELPRHYWILTGDQVDQALQIIRNRKRDELAIDRAQATRLPARFYISPQSEVTILNRKAR